MSKQEVNINYFCSDSYVLSASNTTTQGMGGRSLAFIIQNKIFLTVYSFSSSVGNILGLVSWCECRK